MSGGLDAVADIGLGDILSSAADLGSVVTDFGTEFMSSDLITSFEVPSFDVPSLGGFDVAGSFAGSASWFDTFNPGSILDSIPSVSDFSLPSLPSLPSVSSLVKNPSLVTAGASALGINPSIALAATRTLSGASPVAAGAAALGINPSIVSTATRALGSASPVAAGASALGINPVAQSNLPNSISREVDNTGLTILSASETAQLTRNVNPVFVNSLVDPAASGETAAEANLPVNAPAQVNQPAENQYLSVYDPENGTWSVYNSATGNTVVTGLTEQEALLEAQNLAIDVPSVSLNTSTTGSDDIVAQFEEQSRAAAAQFANESPSPTETDVTALLNQARQEQTIRNLRQNKAASSDWRVRLRLAPNSTYLYNDPNPGVLAPLASKTGTDGVIFPYTPNIDTAYKANYDAYDLTHSNYRGYFYKNSYVDSINMRAMFTAQDTEEANYLLAVIHFFRSATKMFYGQDSERGSPPPLVYLSGYGDFQFNEHPCVISQFNYTLPSDVDYIRAQSALDASTSMLGNRVRQTTSGNPLSYAINRLLNNNLTRGALDNRPDLASNFAVGNPTYVPTKIEISVSLLPIQSRQQVSTQFSLRGFANGNLLKGGFW